MLAVCLLCCAGRAGAPLLLVHVSGQEAAAEIGRAQQERGHCVFGETCPQYLTLTGDINRNNPAPPTDVSALTYTQVTSTFYRRTGIISYSGVLATDVVILYA